MYPFGHIFQNFYGKGFFDDRVFGRCSRFCVLKKVVQFGEAFDDKRGIVAKFKIVLDGFEVFSTENLHVFFSVYGENRALNFSDSFRGIVFQEKSTPGA